MFSLRSLLLTVIAAGMSLSANAVIVQSELVSLGGNAYQYNYSITNDDIASGFDELSIYFDGASYDNLNVVASPDGWDSVTLPATIFLPYINYPGVFDTIALAQPLGLGETISGFSVSFDWIGIGLPGTQHFDVIDIASTTVLQSGTTVVSAVPVPGALPLLASAFTGLMVLRQRKIGKLPAKDKGLEVQ
jgi:hypothetical protein